MKVAETDSAVDISPVPDTWQRRHLLGLEELSKDDVLTLLHTAVELKAATGGCKEKISILKGKTIANMFFDKSTRTRNSFSLGARRLCAELLARLESAALL